MDQIAAAWRRRSSLNDLKTVSGPWAIVVWDPDAAEYLLVSDPVGVQPLYWARTRPGEMVVSSWLDALLEQPGVDDAIDYEGLLLDSTAGLFSEQVLHRTRFASVSRVPWGRTLRVRSDGSTRLEQYWDPRSLPGPDNSMTLEEAAQLLRERIDIAVKRSVSTSDSVGGHVSGGLDCTALSCRASQVLTESGHSFVAGYSWAPNEVSVARLPGDERRLLDEVAAQESLSIRTVSGEESGEWFFDLDLDRYPQTTHFRERFVLPKAQADGVKVMLSGWGGDELASFNGRGVLRQLVRHGDLRSIWSQTTQRAQLSSRPVGHQERVRSFAASVLDGAPDWVPDPRHRAERQRQSATEAEIDGALRAISPVAAEVRRERVASFRRPVDHHEFQLALLTGGHVQRRCEGWYQTGRLFDVSYRYPLLDLDVVTGALRLPWWAFYSQGWTRTAFRLAVEPWVPASVAWTTTKSEPALFARLPTTAPDAGPARPVWRGGDAQYQHVLAVAARVNALSIGASRRSQPGSVRPQADPGSSTRTTS